MSLQLHSDSNGFRHYINGKPVKSGDIIEVLVHGSWTKVQYVWSGMIGNSPIGILGFDETTISLTAHTPVRWPDVRNDDPHFKSAQCTPPNCF